MEKDLKRVYVTKDDDGHNYVIPYEDKETFKEFLEKDEYAFIATYSKYMTRGDINLIELYARI